MSRPAPDMRAVVRALDALTTQVRRIADYRQTDFALTPDAADDDPTTADDACRTVEIDGETVYVRGSGDFTDQDAQYLGEIVRAAKRKFEAEQAPAADEDAQHIARRRDSLMNLLDRLDRNWTLSADERAFLRRQVQDEIREADTARAVAAGNKRHVQTIVPEIDRLARELEEARADLARYEQVQGDMNERAIDLTRRAEEVESERNQLAAVLAEVLRQFTMQTGDPDDPRVRTPWLPTSTVDQWRSVVQHDVERPWWQQLDEARAELAEAQAALKGVRNAAHLHRKQLLSTAELYAVIGPVDPDGTEQPTTEQPSTCTATIPDALGSAALHRCVAPAGHYDESDEPVFTGEDRSPGGWHTDGEGHVWSDRAAAATPHGEQQE